MTTNEMINGLSERAARYLLYVIDIEVPLSAVYWDNTQDWTVPELRYLVLTAAADGLLIPPQIAHAFEDMH